MAAQIHLEGAVNLNAKVAYGQHRDTHGVPENLPSASRGVMWDPETAHAPLLLSSYARTFTAQTHIVRAKCEDALECTTNPDKTTTRDRPHARPQCRYRCWNQNRRQTLRGFAPASQQQAQHKRGSSKVRGVCTDAGLQAHAAPGCSLT